MFQKLLLIIKSSVLLLNKYYKKIKMLRCSYRRLHFTRLIKYNNYQDLGNDTLPTRSYINSLFCQQVDIDWLNLYPTLPSQQIATIVHEESEKLSRLIKTDERQGLYKKT